MSYNPTKLLREIERRCQTVQTSGENVKEEILLRYNNIKHRLTEVYQNHMSQIDTEIKEEVKRFESTKNRIKNLEETILKLDEDQSSYNLTHKDLNEEYQELLLLEESLQLHWRKTTYEASGNDLTLFSKECEILTGLSFSETPILNTSQQKKESDPLQIGSVSKQCFDAKDAADSDKVS